MFGLTAPEEAEKYALLVDVFNLVHHLGTFKPCQMCGTGIERCCRFEDEWGQSVGGDMVQLEKDLGTHLAKNSPI